MSDIDPSASFVVPDPTAGERRSILLWQGTDRFYSEVQRFVRTGIGTEAAEEVAEDLARVTRRSRTTRTVEAWRGNRSARQAFGRDGEKLDELTGTRADGV